MCVNSAATWANMFTCCMIGSRKKRGEQGGERSHSLTAILKTLCRDQRPAEAAEPGDHLIGPERNRGLIRLVPKPARAGGKPNSVSLLGAPRQRRAARRR